jgi:Cu-Zn family superoxide dismutase
MRSTGSGHSKKAHWLFLALLCGTLGSLTACGDDENATGAGGAAGTGGTAGTGGSSGTGGRAGDSGVADSQPDAPGKQALATIQGRSGSNVTGTALFTQSGATVTLEIELEGISPAGPRGVHIHQNGTCGAADGGATEAGGHWNPADASHGSPDAGARHLGDVGNITIGSDGRGTLTFSTNAWSIGTGTETDVAGHALVIHGIEDTLLPDAAFGPRIGCGVITLAANGGG